MGLDDEVSRVARIDAMKVDRGCMRTFVGDWDLVEMISSRYASYSAFVANWPLRLYPKYNTNKCSLIRFRITLAASVRSTLALSASSQLALQLTARRHLCSLSLTRSTQQSRSSQRSSSNTMSSTPSGMYSLFFRCLFLVINWFAM